MNMPVTKSLDVPLVIDHILRDVFANHVGVFSTLAQKQTRRKLRKRLGSEGIGFLTKTLPAVGKCFDNTLAGGEPFDCTKHRLKPSVPGGKLPHFLGELFERVLHADGTLREDACVSSVRTIRQVSYLFYKYELPYTHEQETQVISAFEQAEKDLIESNSRIQIAMAGRRRFETSVTKVFGADRYEANPSFILSAARLYLHRLFEHFDPKDIIPRHGPGAVAQRERGPDKYRWTKIPKRLADEFPIDAYFRASLGHVCDSYRELPGIEDCEPSARVVLVPKDSRGPRLISCEPAALQWIQQGLRQAIYRSVEVNPLSKDNVFFTNQQPNQYGALLGSQPGVGDSIDGYATLDLKEASDRVSVELVKTIFPEPLLAALLASRSCSTVVTEKGTNGSLNERTIQMIKFAPMGSALCFPIMALTVFSLLRASLQCYWDACALRDSERSVDTSIRGEFVGQFMATAVRAARGCRRACHVSSTLFHTECQRILVYGDDIIVPRYFARTAIAALEFFGLKANLRKCCTSGFFRESCGVDAFKGFNVTPVKLKTVWDTSSSAEVYESWIEYTNSLLRSGYEQTAKYLAGKLTERFRLVPSTAHHRYLTGAPALKDPLNLLGIEVTDPSQRIGIRWNSNLQRIEYKVLFTKPKKSSRKFQSGWDQLLRFFTERASNGPRLGVAWRDRLPLALDLEQCQSCENSSPDDISVYTAPRTSVLVRGWR